MKILFLISMCGMIMFVLAAAIFTDKDWLPAFVLRVCIPLTFIPLIIWAIVAFYLTNR